MISNSSTFRLQGSPQGRVATAFVLSFRTEPGREASSSLGWQDSKRFVKPRKSSTASATCFESEVLPRQPSLPESWDARSLDDESISEELQRLKLRRRPLSTRTLSTKKIRAVRNSRLKFRTRSAAPEAAENLGVQPGKHLSAKEQAKLCSKWQEWQRIQEFVPPVRGSRDDFTKAWASEAQVSEKQLARIEAEGPLAAHLLLASVERLLHQVCFRYTSGGVDIEDVIAEARHLWLEAAAKCDPSRASLNSFGILYLRQRLPPIVDRLNNVLDQPPSAHFAELKVYRVRNELESRLSREPSIEEIAASAQMTRISVQHVLEQSKGYASLDKPVESVRGEGDDSTLADTLAGEVNPEADNNLNEQMHWEMEETLRELMDKNLRKEGEREICELYYGFNQEKGRSLREISRMYDMSVEAVRKRLIKARAHLNKNGDLEKKIGPYVNEGILGRSDPENSGRIVDLSSEVTNYD